MLFLRSLLFSIGMIITTAIIGPLVIIAFPLKFEIRYAITKVWTRFNIWWLKTTCGIDYEIQGLENVPNEAVIVLAKHQSTWETLFLHQLLPPLTWVVKRELVYMPIFGWALALLQPIAINRQSSKVAIKQILSQGKHYLDLGRWVLLFPEGTRTAPGQRQRYRLGGARLAAYSHYPVLPVAHNAGEFWPRRGFIKRPGTITVVFGPLIASRDRSPEDINAEAEAWIENTMLQITNVSFKS